MVLQFQETLLRKPRVLEMTGWSNSTLYNRISAGLFKPGVKVGPRIVAWPQSEVEAYIQARISERDGLLGEAA
ncbi:helix-turn-helix transcriptional regulator [Comamonas testosteroni]|uniref:helix-turn-helix transcriptional regulator n=1 Tax=Comamonas testosteroni TaxID=285 RepID=UPI000AC29587|nr:AlpA family phage regulatory protein [Comamonas testosteroni]